MSVETDDRRDIYDFAKHLAAGGGFLLCKFANRLARGAQDAERGDEMYVENCLELFVGHVLNDAVPGKAGVVDDDVDGTEFGDRGVDEPLGEPIVGNAPDAREHRCSSATERGRRLDNRVIVAIVEDDAGALRGELGR